MAEARTAVGLDGIDYDAPDYKFVAFIDVDRAVTAVARNELNMAVVGDMDSLQREFAVETADGQIVVLRLDRAVDHKNIALGDAFLDHGVADDTAVESRRRIGYEVFVEVDCFGYVVLGRRRKAGADAAVGVDKRQFCRRVGPEYFDVCAHK